MDSTSDQRIANNVMRHEYKVLNDADKTAIQAVKDVGLLFHETVDKLGQSREVSLAKTKIEEAVMWAVKHITK
jgi:hypothetical protein